MPIYKSPKINHLSPKQTFVILFVGVVSFGLIFFGVTSILYTGESESLNEGQAPSGNKLITEEESDIKTKSKLIDTSPEEATETDLSNNSLDSDAITEEFAEVIIEGVQTGVFIKDLNSLDTRITEAWCGTPEHTLIDLDVLQVFNRVDLPQPKLDYFESRSATVNIANANIVAAEIFEKLDNKFLEKDLDLSNARFMTTSCGGALHKPIQISADIGLDYENSFTKFFVGGYQYVPRPDEGVGFTVVNVSRSNRNIIEHRFSSVEGSILRFEEIKGIDDCITNDNPNALYDGVDIGCAAQKLENDATSIDKLVNNARKYLEDTVRVND